MKIFIGAGVAAGVVLLAACGSSSDKAAEKPASPKTFSVEGAASVWAPSVTGERNYEGADCSTTGKYDGVKAETPVLVRDAKGTKIGLGKLVPGILRAGSGGLPVCEFQFFVANVPDTGDIFTVQVGDQAEVTFKRDEAQALKLTYK